jgi:hypothetical protein
VFESCCLFLRKDCQKYKSVKVKPDHKNKNLSWGQHWSILAFDVSTTQEFYMKEIISMDFPQHGEILYFYGYALKHLNVKYACGRTLE